MTARLAATLLVGALASAAAGASAQQTCRAEAEEGVIAGAGAFASVHLVDGREIRLPDIMPASALRGQGAVTEGPALPDSFAGAAVTVHAVPDAETDRYGRVVADVALKDTGASLSRHLLREGLALVDPAVMSGACLDALFVAERDAERAGRGLWANGAPVRDADGLDLASTAGSYVLVSGAIESVGETRRTIYLNFGADYRTDFTALIRREDAEGWADTLKALEGRTVRIRGVLEEWNGGLIRVEHLRQIELLPRDRPG